MKKYITCLLLFALLLGQFRGYLALFDSGNAEPRQIYPCKISSLPEEDQAQLEKGIRVRDIEKLNQLLEDYLS